MPGLDGFGLLRALRQTPSTRTIPVIMLSARAGEESRIDGLEAGADDYLVKPFSARELMARVATHLKLPTAARSVWTQRAGGTRRTLFRQSPLPVAVVRGPDLSSRSPTPRTSTSSATGRSSASPCSRRFRSFDGPGFDELLLRRHAHRRRQRGPRAPSADDRAARASAGDLLDFIYSPLRGASGDIDGVVAICNEVTEQVLARQRLEALAAEAEAPTAPRTSSWRCSATSCATRWRRSRPRCS